MAEATVKVRNPARMGRAAKAEGKMEMAYNGEKNGQQMGWVTRQKRR